MTTTPRETLHQKILRAGSGTGYGDGDGPNGRSTNANRTPADDNGGFLRYVGVAAVTGALVVSMCPMHAFAATGSAGGDANASAQATQAASTTKPGSGSTDGGSGDTPPAKPDGDSSGGPGGSGATSGMPGEPPDGKGGGGPNTKTFDYTGTYSATLVADGAEKSAAGETVTATETDQNAALAQNGGTLTLTNSALEKSGDDTDGDRCNFYGANAILLSVGQNSLAKVSGTRMNSTSEGSNAIFATNSGTVLANDVTIITSADNSRGLDATYNGTILANNLNVSTQGEHCAATATDRGGGSVSVTNSTLATSGSGSPLIYSTGDIEVSDTTGTATGSQIAAVEGLNTVLINDSTLESTRTGSSGSDRVANGVLIYQSTSGDAETTTGETATFQATDSTLRSAITSGAMFYLTNTRADVVLSNTTLDFDSSSAMLLLACGNSSNSWGKAGSNGATVRLTGIAETLAGDVEADTISQADVYLTDSTTWTGAAAITENDTASTSESPLNVSVDPTSTWVVTKDSTVSNLTVADGGKVVDSEGRAVTIVAAGETKVKGDSNLTVTVSGTYSTAYDASKAGTVTSNTIDRSAFDQAFGTNTAFALGDTNTASASDASTTASANGNGNGSANGASGSSATSDAADNPVAAWWDTVVSFWKGVFGMA